jgi:hypothetical protein
VINTYDDLLHLLAKEHEKVRRQIVKLEFSVQEQIGWRDMLRANGQPTDKIERSIAGNQVVLLEVSRLAAFHKATERRIRELMAAGQPTTEVLCRT